MINDDKKSDDSDSCWMKVRFEMSGDVNDFLFGTVSFVEKRAQSVISGAFVEEATKVAV